MDSSVGLAIQCIGIFLVTLLSFFIMRSVKSVPSKYWTCAWACLVISLASLFAAFKLDGAARHVLYSFYFLGEYGFGLLFIAGCLNHARGFRIRKKSLGWLVPFGIVALALPYVSEDFNNLFIVQALILALLFAAALYSLESWSRWRMASPGLRVMSAALLLLSFDFLQYVPVFGSHQAAWGLQMPAIYFQFTSIGDLILEILLGFGTIMVLMEGVLQKVEAMNRELTVAHDKLEQIAHQDPLTEALTRHAFDSLFSNYETSRGGCAAVIDIDNLKPINDSYGHPSGDAAIRVVADAIRLVTRAEDTLFRWGGDEFLVLMFGIPEDLARERLTSLNPRLAQTKLSAAGTPVALSVSFGLSSFDAMTDIRQAIEKADSAMYKCKHAAKATKSLVQP